jgi:hypothetical protein
MIYTWFTNYKFSVVILNNNMEITSTIFLQSTVSKAEQASTFGKCFSWFMLFWRILGEFLNREIIFDITNANDSIT